MSARVQQALEQAVAASFMDCVTRKSILVPAGQTNFIVESEPEQVACVPIKEWSALVFAIHDDSRGGVSPGE